MSATIVFRGLMVFHYIDDHMEIGVLNAEAHHGGGGGAGGGGGHVGHVPRIITTKNGVISSIVDLRNGTALGTERDWEIEVSNPIQPTATVFQQGDFDRLHHPYAADFRWLADLEGEDLHNRDLTDELDTSKFSMILRVRHGHFYTHQLSRKLNRRNANPPARQVAFGRAAEVVGCKIEFEIGSVILKAGNTDIFTFGEGDEDGVIYEISNAPPDVPPERPPYQPGAGHFAMYYSHLFRPPRPQDEFQLIPDGGVTPSPDPALCGAVMVGTRSGGF